MCFTTSPKLKLHRGPVGQHRDQTVAQHRAQNAGHVARRLAEDRDARGTAQRLGKARAAHGFGLRQDTRGRSASSRLSMDWIS
jgi:hypothetical protein